MADRDYPQILVKLQVGTGGEFRVVSDQIMALKYSDHERRADELTLTVQNDDLSNFDDPVWRKGGVLIVSWGYPGNMSVPRQCVIQSVKGFASLTVKARDKAIYMHRESKTLVYDNATRSDVVRQIAEDNGYTDETIFVDDTVERFETIPQNGLTDAQFLTRLAALEGFEFYVDYDGFHWHSRRLEQPPSRVISYYIGEVGEIIGEPSIENDITGKPGRVRTRGRDPVAGQDVGGDADNDSDEERTTLSEIIEMIDPETGQSQKKRRQVETPTRDQTVVSDQQTDESAGAEARSRFRRAVQTAVKMSLSIIGDPKLNAKSVVELEGFGKRLSQKYWIKEAVHDLGTSGYTTALKLVSDGHGGHATESRQAEGLTNRGASDSVMRRDQVEQHLVQLVQVAKQVNVAAAAKAERALRIFRQRGFRARNEILGGVRSVAAAGRAENSEALVSAAVQVNNEVLQAYGDEVSQGGQRNQEEPTTTAPQSSSEDGPGPLEVFQEVDPDSGSAVYSYRQPGTGAAE